MKTAQLQRAHRILDEALDLEPEKRVAFVQSVCEDDDAVRSEVESLLAVDSQLLADLDPPPADPGLEEGLLQGGMRIGPYQVVRRLGAGGMGEVYLAR
ncbi:MAG: hypothetical protein KDD47_01425, partial [Acidobacteria bacterium]|nr:hypothetical protein [Acidobacteriota bacterium]